MQERRNPSALTMELRLSCTNPSTGLPQDQEQCSLHCCMLCAQMGGNSVGFFLRYFACLLTMLAWMIADECGPRTMSINKDFKDICDCGISEFQKCGCPWRPVANQQGVQNKQPSVIYVFGHKTKNILIYAPHTHIVAFWHIRNIPPRVS